MLVVVALLWSVLLHEVGLQSGKRASDFHDHRMRIFMIFLQWREDRIGATFIFITAAAHKFETVQAKTMLIIWLQGCQIYFLPKGQF